MGVTSLLLAPLRFARRGAADVRAIAEATRSLPRLELALATQLAALLTRLGDLSLQVEQVPGPLHAIARELPAVGTRLGVLQRDVEQVAGALDGATGDVATIGRRMVALEGAVAQVSEQLAGLQAGLDGLSATVKDAAEHLPEPDDAGVLSKARDVFGGGASS